MPEGDDVILELSSLEESDSKSEAHFQKRFYPADVGNDVGARDRSQCPKDGDCTAIPARTHVRRTRNVLLVARSDTGEETPRARGTRIQESSRT